MVEEKEKMHKQVAEELVKTVDQKNYMVVVLRNMVDEVDSMRLKAEEEKRKMEEQHKRDLEALQLEVQAREATHNERMSAHQMALTKELRALVGRRQAVKETERVTERLRREIMAQEDVHAAMQYEEKRIIRKHEDGIKAVEMAVQDQKRKLIERQELELQKQHVQGTLDIKKSNETDKDRIAELKSEQEMIEDMVNALSQNEGTANNLPEDVEKVAIQVLDTFGVGGLIGNKLLGWIDRGPWVAACRNKFQYHPDGWELVMIRILSEWTSRIEDPSYHPFKMLSFDPREIEWKRSINEDDEFLKRLKDLLGAEVMQTVVTALFEMEEYNASGRYPMLVAWNFEENERIQPRDLLLFLQGLLEGAMAKLAKTNTKRARVSQ